MEQDLRNLVAAANRTLARCGVRLREYEQDGHAVVQAYVPTSPRAVVISARVALPSDVVGADIVGGKVARKIKKVAKKIAKSKILKAVASIAAVAATGGAAAGPIAAATAAAKLAGKLKRAAKTATPKQKQVLKLIARKATSNLNKMRGTAAPVAPGYPSPLAARLPDARLPDAIPSNGFADSDPEELEAQMDPDQGAAPGEVDLPDDAESVDDTAESDSEAFDEAE